MDNLFKVAMGEDLGNYEAIKRNKAFALRLLNDLSTVYTVNESVTDNSNSVTIGMRRSPNYNPKAFFNATAEGVFFISDVLGYYEAKTVKPIGELYEKYRAEGTKRTNGNDTFVKGDHAAISFKIKLSENASDLPQRLKDVMYLLDRQDFVKRF